MFSSHLLFAFVHRKDRIDGNPADRDLVRRYSQYFEISARFINRHEVLLVVMAKPHRVHIEICHHDRLPARQTLFCFEPRDNFGRQKMRTDNHVRLIFAQDFDEGARV